MTISTLKRLLFVALILIHQMLTAQQTPVIEVRGRGVEMVNGKAVGVPQVTVSITDVDYDITEVDGSFTIHSEASNQKFVKLTLTTGLNNRKMLAPIEDVVNIPPSKNIEVLLCSQQNQALKSKVAALNTKIKSLQSKYNLSARQVQNLQKGGNTEGCFFGNAVALFGTRPRCLKRVHFFSSAFTFFQAHHVF